MSGKATTGLLRIRHDQHDLEFLTGRIVSETGGNWFLRIQASQEAGEYREHLVRGAPMDLSWWRTPATGMPARRAWPA